MGDAIKAPDKEHSHAAALLEPAYVQYPARDATTINSLIAVFEGRGATVGVGSVVLIARPYLPM